MLCRRVSSSSHSDQNVSKSQRASKSPQWFKSYGHFTEGVDFAYWWSFSGGGSAINRATPSSVCIARETATYLFSWCINTQHNYLFRTLNRYRGHVFLLWYKATKKAMLVKLRVQNKPILIVFKAPRKKMVDFSSQNKTTTKIWKFHCLNFQGGSHVENYDGLLNNRTCALKYHQTPKPPWTMSSN